MRRRLLMSLSILLLGAGTIQSEGILAQVRGKQKDEPTLQQPDESFFHLLQEVLNINIAARVSEAGEGAIWTVENSELTIPGRSVQVKLVGKNIIIIAAFTPYLKENREIILVAQGQVWISSSGTDGIKYLTTMKNIPITLGEKVLFFPLGVRSLEQEGRNLYNIELEIQVLPFNREQERK